MNRRVLIGVLLLNLIIALGAGFWFSMTYLMRRTYARSLYDDYGDGVVYQQAVDALENLASDMIVPSAMLLGATLLTNGVLLTLFLKQVPAGGRTTSRP
ncbi:MAG: hypothetical protein ACF8K1_05620 [Phycisphaerales bacterium JB047]